MEQIVPLTDPAPNISPQALMITFISVMYGNGNVKWLSSTEWPHVLQPSMQPTQATASDSRIQSIGNDSNEPHAADVTAGGGTISTLSSGIGIPVPFTARDSSDLGFNTDSSWITLRAMVLNRNLEIERIDALVAEKGSNEDNAFAQNVVRGQNASYTMQTSREALPIAAFGQAAQELSFLWSIAVIDDSTVPCDLDEYFPTPTSRHDCLLGMTFRLALLSTFNLQFPQRVFGQPSITNNRAKIVAGRAWF
jgi:hypothetical protein